MPRVFLITGTSTGFGYHLVQEVIGKGDRHCYCAQPFVPLIPKHIRQELSAFGAGRNER